jgi:glutamine amidotransferase
MNVIIDYGMGNLGSILNMLKKIGAGAVVSSDISEIEKADKLILPGVGAFDSGMKNLTDHGLIPVLNDRVIKERTPLLGICLGMQLFTKRSEEGKLEGMGWFDAETVRFNFDDEESKLKIPHMGWNYIKVEKENNLFKNTDGDSRFYFVHSYHVVCNQKDDILATTLYGYEFVSAINRDNIFGVQFHPEKSHKFGMKILKNFIDL